jgi:hypothetical protein
MQQRQPRLGDILDDYCPRERRVTNHAVVAMIDLQVKQTRCTTCDTEHEYKHAKLPTLRKKKESPAALYKQVLTDAGGDAAAGAPAEPSPLAQPPARRRAKTEMQPEPAPVPGSEETPVAAPPGEEEVVTPEMPMAAQAPEEEEGPVHRRLIRATLPRPDGIATTRPTPQFTLRQPPGRTFQGKKGSPPPSGGGRGRQASTRGGTFGHRPTARPAGAIRHTRQPQAGHPARHGKKPR